MSSHFVDLLEQLQRRCLGMANLARSSVQHAGEALCSRDLSKAQSVSELEKRIDLEEVEIERAAINLLALHQPAAGDLRMVCAILKINGDLERIGDCSMNIAQQVSPFIASEVELPQEMRLLAETTLRQVDQTIRCIATRDTDLANQVVQADDAIDALYNHILQDLQAGMVANTAAVPGDLALIMAAKNFERIGDHCTNIAEDVVFLLRGQIIRHVHPI